jgi:tetratricopeptide (TPR) repeat protein
MDHFTFRRRATQIGAVIALASMAQVAAANDGEIVMVQGQVEVKELASEVWRNAQARQTLRLGASVRTGEASQTAILVSDKTQVRLSQGSLFKLTQAGDAQGGTQLELVSGRMWAQAKQFTVDVLRATTSLVSRKPKLAVRTPTATIGIRGTDWEVTVNDQGETQVVVLSGEVSVDNDHGQVLLGPSEQAIVRLGMAPSKSVLARAQDRVQWVNAVRLDVQKYPDLAQSAHGEALQDALTAGRVDEARQATEALLNAPEQRPKPSPAGAWLLAADFAWSAGDLTLAEQRLAQGQARFPSDDRFAASSVRAALFRGDLKGARQLVDEAHQRIPASTELALVAAELARLEGQGAAAVAGFTHATRQLPVDVRAWHGLGSTLAEQENFSPARTALRQALSLVPDHAETLADLGALETRANRLVEAEAAIDQSLAQAPDDYVAWTSRGILLLTQGQPEAALDALLKAGLLEPRYAKAQIYTAIAWYQLGRPDAALGALDRAKKADPNDPLPYFYEAQIHRDSLNPVAALHASREAVARFPYLKSLGPIATDRQGSANLGTSYAMLGLEAWAQRMAQQSQHPFFAGSYLFTADRTNDSFVKNSALLQGYLTDPTMFGASPQLSTLMNSPGGYTAVDMGFTRNAQSRQSEPSIIANGYRVSPVPMAGFVQYTAPRVFPGQLALNGQAPSFITALGVKPSANLGLFLYREEFRPEFFNVKLNTANSRLLGEERRTQLGAQWQVDPRTAWWFMAGQGEGRFEEVGSSQVWARSSSQVQPEWGLRFTALRDSGEWSLVAERGQRRQTSVVTSSGRLSFGTGVTSIDAVSHQVSATWKRKFEQWLLQFDVNYSDFQFARNESARVTYFASGSVVTAPPLLDLMSSRVVTPNLGLAWSPTAGSTYRLVYQDVTRPAGAASLAQQDTAGISLDVPGLEGGGRLKRWRLQGEWELGGDVFAKAFVDHRRLKNLTSEYGGLLNEAADISQVRRLRQQGVLGAESIESLAGTAGGVPSGVVHVAGLVLEGVSGTQWGWSAAYLHHRTENFFLPNVPLPDYPEHMVRFGLNWFAPNRWVIRTALTGRSERAGNLGGTKVLQPDWDLSLSAAWQDEAKRRLFEVFTTGQLRKDLSPTYGVRGIWRF